MKKIAGLLSAATCSLLANPVQAEEPNWDIDSAVLYYNEDDDRVSAFEPVISGKRDLVYQAALLDPHTSAVLSIDETVSLCDEMIEAHGDYLPKLS